MFSEQLKRLEKFDMKNMFKKLKGKFVPISKTDKIKLIDANDKEFTFERDLEEDGVNYFREWLKDEMQKYIRKELLG